jgi:hypothetical protein
MTDAHRPRSAKDCERELQDSSCQQRQRARAQPVRPAQRSGARQDQVQFGEVQVQLSWAGCIRSGAVSVMWWGNIQGRLARNILCRRTDGACGVGQNTGIFCNSVLADNSRCRSPSCRRGSRGCCLDQRSGYPEGNTSLRTGSSRAGNKCR